MTAKMEVEHLSKPAPMSYRAKILTSCTIWFCAMSLGICTNMISPTLVELSSKYQTDIESISIIFSIWTFSMLCTSLISGLLYNYINRQLTASIFIFSLGVGAMFIPHAPTLTILFVIGSLMGICTGGFNTAQIVWIIEMWGHEASVYIQIQHFCYALGSVISPLLVKPFLTSESDQEISSTVSPFYPNNSTESIRRHIYLKNIVPTSTMNPLFYIPFTIAGTFAVTGGIGICLMYHFNPYQSSTKVEKSFQSPCKLLEKLKCYCHPRKLLLVILSATFVGAYQGMEMCTNQFFPTFMHYIKLGLSKRHAALIQSGLSGGFTIGRGLGILLAVWVFPEYILLGNFVLIMVGNSLLWSYANSSLETVWAASITLGLGYSTVFPSFYGYIQKHLEITNIMAAVMSVSGGLVASIYPIFIGQAIESNPFVLMHTNFISVSVVAGSFLILYTFVIVNEPCTRTQPVMHDTETVSGGTNSGYISS